MFSFRGSSSHANAAFWIDNSIFALTGYSTYKEPGEFTIELYDIENKKCYLYTLKQKNENHFSYTLMDMKNRGIIVDE